MSPIGPDDATLHPGQVGHASPSLFIGLIDDAAMFPPRNASLERALAEHAHLRASWYAALIGPLLVPASRVPELTELVAGQSLPGPLPIGVIVPDGVDAAAEAVVMAASSGRLEVVGLELPLDRAFDLRTDWARLSGGTRAVWWEVSRDGDVRTQLDAVAGAGGDLGGAKLRTGGPSADSFPSEPEVAAFLRHAIDVDLAFKLTAGLHHAVRRTDPATGFEQHGVLNLLCAIKAALNGAEVDELATLLAERDAEPLVERTNGMSEADASVARAFWSSFGCCGATDPIEELLGLGLLAPAATTSGAAR